MTQKKLIEDWLKENCTMTTAQGCADGTGLTLLHQEVFGHKKNVKKAEAAKDLAEFYSIDENITSIWNGGNLSNQLLLNGDLECQGALGEIEKAFITPVVQYGGREFKQTSKIIAAEYGLEYKSPDRGYYSYRWIDIWRESNYYGEYYYLAFLHILKQKFPKTRAVLLFPGGMVMPPFIVSVLKKIIPPFEYKYTEFNPSKKDYVICREGKLNDFAAVVRFAGGEKLKVKDYTFDITKAKMAKMTGVLELEEVCDNNGRFCVPKEAMRINDFKVALPLFVLAANIGLVDIDKAGNVTPGAKALELLADPAHLFAKKLFNSYTEKNNIHEIHYVTYITLYNGESCIEWKKCRKAVIDMLKTCPIEQWVSFKDFEKHLTIFQGNFFRGDINSRAFIQGHDASYYNTMPDWQSCEARIINVMLSFLGAMGILDIAYTEKVIRFKEIKNDYFVGISGFRITPLGAWILGLSKDYKPSEPKSNIAMQSGDGGFVVQPDHTVIISGLKNRVEHESYLSRFLTKISSDDNVSCYKIDFASMVRAYNEGVEPNKIKNYLEKAIKNTQHLPDNVIRSFNDWQTKVGKVKIRNVTIVECDDALILEELIHAKPLQSLLGGRISFAAVITEENNKARVKSYAEKNGWLVENKTEMKSLRRKKGSGRK